MRWGIPARRKAQPLAAAKSSICDDYDSTLPINLSIWIAAAAALLSRRPNFRYSAPSAGTPTPPAPTQNPHPSRSAMLKNPFSRMTPAFLHKLNMRLYSDCPVLEAPPGRRACSHYIRCPACGSNQMPKHGASQGRPVYRCGDCGRYYTYAAAYTRPSAADRERARALLGEGVSQSAIARIVGVTPPAVHRWVKNAGCRTLPPPETATPQRTAR